MYISYCVFASDVYFLEFLFLCKCSPAFKQIFDNDLAIFETRCSLIYELVREKSIRKWFRNPDLWKNTRNLAEILKFLHYVVCDKY